MSAPSSEASKDQSPAQASPTRPKLISRSITEVSPPSLHRSYHRHAHHHHHHLHRSKEPQNIQMNFELNPPYVGDGNTSNEGSRNVSRKGSIFEDLPRKQITALELEEERERGAMRASELRSSVFELNALSNRMTRKLDLTYYSVLEKTSLLQNTITSLKELASITRAVSAEFKSGSEEVTRDTKAQLDTFEGFTKQEKRINALKKRVEEGRKQIRILGERVDVVKERVDRWEKAEWEGQVATRKRLNILWILMGLVAIVIATFRSSQYIFAQAHNPLLPNALNNSTPVGRKLDLEGLKNETWRLETKIEKSFKGLQLPETDKDQGDEDPRLRIFDDL